MLDNEFDQLFRDRLLNHSSRIHLSLWKRVHTHLLRNKAFHFWKWYIVGPSAVVVAVTGHFLLAHLSTTDHKNVGNHAVATYESRPAASASVSAAATNSDVTNTDATTAATGATVTTATSTTSSTRPTTTSAALTTTTAEATKTAATHHRLATHTNRRTANTPNQNTNRHSGSRPFGNHSSGLTGAHHRTNTITGDGTDNDNSDDAMANAPRPPIPAQTTAQIKINRLKTPAIVAAKTPNPKTPHQLILPAIPPRSSGKLHLDVFGSPEYFAFKSFGLSYGAGARVTLVFRDHLTLTTGFQYLRINANHLTSKDSLNGLLPGYFSNVHVPLLLGYTTGNRRFSFSANAGLIFSLYAQANGALKTTDNWPSHIGPNFYMGLNFSSHVTDRISLFAEPYLKCWYPPGNLRLPSQLWSSGLMVGLRYNF